MVPQPRLCLQEDFSKQVMVQLAKSVFNDKLSKKSSKMFLKSARAHFNLLANIWSSQYGINIDPTTIVKQIPVTQEAVFLEFGWSFLDEFMRFDVRNCETCQHANLSLSS